MGAIGVTYSDDNMTLSQKKCAASMLANGVQYVYSAREKDIDVSFKTFNKDIFKEGVRGAGCYWIFKPYFIEYVMRDLKDGDLLIYSDAGVELVNNISHIVDRMDENIFLFTNTHPNHHWTKRLTLDTMYRDWHRIYERDTPWPQIQASVIFIKVCKETRDFIKKWLLWCQMPDLINDITDSEYTFYQDHRHDQSILTVLATFAGYKLHWWPTAYAEHIRVPGDNYPVMFNHHRKRNHEW